MPQALDARPSAPLTIDLGIEYAGGLLQLCSQVFKQRCVDLVASAGSKREVKGAAKGL